MRYAGSAGKIRTSKFQRDMFMVTSAIDSRSAGNQNAAIEALARKTDMPIAIVKEIYLTQHSQLERTARVKTYLPVLASSRVKHILNARKALRDEASEPAVA